MTITCTLCNQPFTSLIINHETALREISGALVQHLNKEHKPEAQLLARDHMTLASIGLWYML